MASIRDRIANLNLEQVHTPAPGTAPKYTFDEAIITKKKPPPPPTIRNNTVNIPPISNAPSSAIRPGNQPAAPPNKSPALPPRPQLPPRPSSREPPKLPPRRDSQPASLRKRDSNESIASQMSTLSRSSTKTTASNGTVNGGRRTSYVVRAPEFDPTKLPPLPVRQVSDDSKPPSSIRAVMKSNTDVKAPRSLPPPLPTRGSDPKATETNSREDERRAIQPPPRQKVSALKFAMNTSTEAPPPIPSTRPKADLAPEPGLPPPIPLASRPNLDAILASKPKPGAAPASCLVCRDFSAPDHHASLFPRTSLPSSDVTWLATQLTAPFPSATDKARAIFVWLHHNVDYDCHSFFSGTVSRSTPERTITSGLAVCEGYAALFAALALKAGMEALVVSGHGKGYGHSALTAGEALPPFSSNHAWTAIRIDNGQWKLMDACWGAGHLGSGGTYNRHFTASEFTKSNEEFGFTHYPTDTAHLFRNDGRTYTWEDYMMDDMGERLQVCGEPEGEHGIGRRTFQPAGKQIKVYDAQDPVVRFQFSVACPHWDHERNGKGKPYVMTLNVGGRDGRKTQHLPFNTDGRCWWLDVNRLDLGAPGQKIIVACVTSFDKRDGRGLTVQEYKAKAGRVASSWGSVCSWELI